MPSTIIGSTSRLAENELIRAHKRFADILVKIIVNNYPAKSINLSIAHQNPLKHFPEVSKADVSNLELLISRQRTLIENSLLISKNLKTYCLQPLGADIYLKVSNPRFPGQIHGLTTCKKYWICPRCSEAISIGHTKDIQIAVDAANKLGKKVSVITLTIPHNKSDNLSQLLKTMKEAWILITKRQAFKSIYEAGFIGYIRKLEITYNQQNGFNPHFHLIIFYEGGNICDKDEIESTIFEAWQAAIIKKSCSFVSQKDCSEIKQPKNAFAQYYGKSFFENNPYLLKQNLNDTIKLLNVLNREIYINSESIRVLQKSKDLYEKLKVKNKEKDTSIKRIAFNSFD